MSSLGSRRAEPNEQAGVEERTLVLWAPKVDPCPIYSEDVDLRRSGADVLAFQGADGLEAY